jgi:glycine betaine/proline transport system permease protein
MFSFIVTGFWVPTMKTTYLVLIAVTLSVLIGVPLGILAANPIRFLPMLLTGIASIEIGQQLAQSAWLPAFQSVSPWVVTLTAVICTLIVLFSIVPIWIRETILVCLAIKQICDIVIWFGGLVMKAALGIAAPILTASGVDVSDWGSQIGTGIMYGPWALTVALIVMGLGSKLFVGRPLVNLSEFFEPITRVIMVTCDTLQTFPSFVYLIPAIMLFRVGDFANVFAIIPYAMVPAIRYTYLGLKRIPEVTIEAAIANGSTPRQRLWKVELPIAIPEIMLGLNQTIMMALAMTAITALIGSTDLGQEVVRSISTQDFGRGILAGFFIAALGIIADRIIGSWAAERKKQLGVG